MPVGDGVTRAVGGVRVLWTQGRVGTAFELQLASPVIHSPYVGSSRPR